MESQKNNERGSPRLRTRARQETEKEKKRVRDTETFGHCEIESLRLFRYS